MTTAENQDYPYERILEDLKYTSTNGQDPLSDICFNMHKKLIRNVKFSKDIIMQPMFLETNTCNQDLMLEIYEDRDIIKGSFVYCSKLFKDSSIKNFINLYKFIIEQVIEDINISIKDIKIVNDNKIQKEINAFNDNF